MRTIRLVEDEAWPDYILDPEHRTAEVELNVPDDVAERWLAARAAWTQAAEEIETAYNAAKGYPLSFSKLPTYPGRRLR